MIFLLKILRMLSPRGRRIWFISVLMGILASIFEVASAAIFSILTSSLFGGRKSNFGILDQLTPFTITPNILIIIFCLAFLTKLLVQWLELHLKTFSAGEFFNNIYKLKYNKMAIESLEREIPASGLARETHTLTHNVYYPVGLIISEAIMLFLLVPFIFLISFKGSLLVFGTTLALSIPLLRIVRRSLNKLNQERVLHDSNIDRLMYTEFRSYFDQRKNQVHSERIQHQLQLVSEIDRRIVKLGSYSRLIIELSFILSITLTFVFLDFVVSPNSRIQFFAVLAYSFFRVIPSFSRIMAARNQLASYRSEFLNLHLVANQDSSTHQADDYKNSFNSKLAFQIRDLSINPNIFSFEAGDFVLLQGNTGIGKTTLLRAIGGIRQGSFSVMVDGKEKIEAISWRPKAAFVSQQPYLSGESVLEMVSGLDSLPEIHRQKYEMALDVSGLRDFERTQRGAISNEQISGGERKQIALARALYSEPDLLLLDELTAGMDKSMADEILRKLRLLDSIKIIVLTSHDLEIEHKFSKVIRLNEA